MELIDSYMNQQNKKLTIKDARISAGMTIDDVCSILDIPVGLLEAYEKYYYAIHPVVAVELANLYRVPLSSLTFN